MTWEKQDILIKGHQALPDGPQQQGLFAVALRRADPATHQGVSGEQSVPYLKYQAVQTVTGDMDDLHLKVTERQHLVVAYGSDWILIGREGGGVDGRVVYLDQGTQTCCMCLMPVGKKHMFQLELVGFDEVYQFSVHMTGVNEDGITAILRTYEIGVAESYD